MSSPSLESSLVRILIGNDRSRRPVGAGFLIRSNQIVTCAHVINTALGRRQDAADKPNLPVFIDFPLLTHQPLLKVNILKWFPIQENPIVLGSVEDIAVLEFPFDNRPAGIHPAPIISLEKCGNFFVSPAKVKMCGFPVEAEHGTYVNCTLQGVTAKGWIELHHDGHELISHGFSGTAVWTLENNAVCGIIVSLLNRQHSTVAYMIPADNLVRALKATAFSIKNVQFLIWEKLLKKVDSLSDDSKVSLLMNMTEAVIKRIMVEAFDRLTEEKQEDFSDLMDENNPPTPDDVDNFLNESLPGDDYEFIANDAINDLEKNINEVEQLMK